MTGEFSVPTFAGTKILQTWGDLHVWEEFFNTCPIRTFIELGSGVGGSSLFFALQCYQRGIRFHTFDNQNFIDFNSPLHRLLNVESAFHFVDLFSEEGQRQVREIIEGGEHPLAIFFDNGDKPREWGLFAPLTRAGDYCIVHDWGSEFKKRDIGKVDVEEIMKERGKPPRWKAKWFMRK